MVSGIALMLVVCLFVLNDLKHRIQRTIDKEIEDFKRGMGLK